MMWIISLLTPAETLRRYNFKRIDQTIYEEEDQLSPKSLRAHTRFYKILPILFKIFMNFIKMN